LIKHLHVARYSARELQLTGRHFHLQRQRLIKTME